MAESELGVGSAVQTDVGSTFGRWVTEQLGRAWPGDYPAPPPTPDPVLAPAQVPRRRTFVRPVEQDPEKPISMVAATAMRDLLASWRAAERELAGIPEASPAWAHANARLISLRVAYQRLFDEGLIAPR